MNFMRELSITLIIIIVLITVNISCTKGQYLKTESADADITGTYSVLFYANRHPIEPKTIAILDIEGDDYTFEIEVPKNDYTINKGVPAGAALENAAEFVESPKYHINKILDDNGRIIGYDVRPLYHISYRIGGYGPSDILAVNYEIRDTKVVVNIDLRRHVKEYFQRDMFRGN